MLKIGDAKIVLTGRKLVLQVPEKNTTNFRSENHNKLITQSGLS